MINRTPHYMKYFAIICFCFCALFSHAQIDDSKPLNDLDFNDFESLDFDFKDLESLGLNFKDLESLGLNFDLNDIFGQLDSLPLQLGQFGDIEKLFGDQLLDLSQNEDLFQDLLQQSFKSLEKIDMGEMQGLMENFMKEFEGLNLDEMIDREELDKIMDKNTKAKTRKI